MKNEQERQRIGRRIADLRANRKMTQKELAERAGLQRTHVVRLESGAYGATVDVLSAIASALGCTLDLND